MRSVFGTILCLVASGVADGGDWPGWRGGPRGDGLSDEKNIPIRIEPQTLRWKVPIPGRGHSSPIVFGNRVILTTCIEDATPARRELIMLDRHDGRIVWRKTVIEARPEALHRLNSRASGTPATDGKRIFVSFLDQSPPSGPPSGKREADPGELVVAAFDFNGNRLWEKRPGPFRSVHGFCTCPVLYQDKLIINGDHDGDAFLAMMRQEDGAIVWKVKRENRLRSYCTPIVAAIGGRDQLLLSGGKTTAAYECSTGEMIWTCDGPSEQMVATLLRGHGMIYSLGGYPERHLLAIAEDGKGDVTKSHVKWKSSSAIPYVPSALLDGDLLHVVSDEGVYTCFDAKSGKVHGRKRISSHVSASLVAAEGAVYILDDKGALVVIASEPKYRELAKSELGEDAFATPAIAHGCLFIRGEKHLFCLGAKLSGN